MAFDRQNFARAGDTPQGDTGSIWTYKTEDTSGTYLADNYFDEMWSALKIGDRILITVVDNLGESNESFESSDKLIVEKLGTNPPDNELSFDTGIAWRSEDYNPDLTKKQEWSLTMRIDDVGSSFCEIMRTVASSAEDMLFRFEDPGGPLRVSMDGGSNFYDFSLTETDVRGKTLDWYLTWDPGDNTFEVKITGQNFDTYREKGNLTVAVAPVQAELFYIGRPGASGTQGITAMIKNFIGREEGVIECNFPMNEGSGDSVTDIVNGYTALDVFDWNFEWTAAGDKSVTVRPAAGQFQVFGGSISSSTIDVNTTAGTAITWNDSIESDIIEHDDADSAIQFLEAGEYAFYLGLSGFAEVGNLRVSWEVYVDHDTASDVDIFDYNLGTAYERAFSAVDSGMGATFTLNVNAGDKVTFVGRRHEEEAGAGYERLETDTSESFLSIFKLNRG